MTDYEADVIPDQPWNLDGTATVIPKAPCPYTGPFSLPLEHREGSPVTVQRSEYPTGLVIIPADTTPVQDPAVLPLKIDSGESILINEEGDHQSWPIGIVARFID